MGLFDFLKKRKNNILSDNTKTVTVENPILNPSKEAIPHIPVNVSVSDEFSPLNDGEIQDIFEQRMSKAIPTNNGLYPHEILMLDYADSYKFGDNNFQGFWRYQYYVLKPEIILNSLYERNFIEMGDVESGLKRVTVTRLKKVLADNGLKVSGKKADLITRLLDGLPLDVLEREFPERYYKLTDLGKQELIENEYVPYIHRHSRSDLDIWSLNVLVQTPPRYPYRDKIWGYLNEESQKHAQVGQWGLYRNTRLTMSDFLKEEEKYTAAFKLLVEVIYYDLSGLDNSSNNEMSKWEKEIRLESFFPYESSLITIPPGIITKLKTYMELLDWDISLLESELVKEFGKLSTFRHVFTKEECLKIVMAELNEDIQTLNKIYNTAKKRIEQT